jgi:hypothetical protein
MYAASIFGTNLSRLLLTADVGFLGGAYRAAGELYTGKTAATGTGVVVGVAVGTLRLALQRLELTVDVMNCLP